SANTPVSRTSRRAVTTSTTSDSLATLQARQRLQGISACTPFSDHCGRNWLFFVLYSATAILSIKIASLNTNAGHRHASSQAVI
ncbi:hypothetical protein, partial [Pseudomonas sp.]|uniref:hypothetical protein n=1 Tax=Pseudomonas sp. TaxID=306 RepID=UPI003FD85F04